MRAFRGGSVENATLFCRSEYSDSWPPFFSLSTFGFRAVLPLP